jgi:hypothetical protein
MRDCEIPAEFTAHTVFPPDSIVEILPEVPGSPAPTVTFATSEKNNAPDPV